MCGHREAALHAVRTSQCAGSKRRSCCIYAVGTPGAGRYPTLRRHDLCPIDRHHSRILSRHVPARPERAVLALGRNAEEGRDAGGRNRECGRMECDVIAGDGYPYKEPLPTFLSSFFLFSFSFLTQQLVTDPPPPLYATTFPLPPSIKPESASQSISEYRRTAPLAGKPDLFNPHPLRPHHGNLGRCVPNNHDLEHEPHVLLRPRPGIHKNFSGSSFC